MHTFCMTKALHLNTRTDTLTVMTHVSFTTWSRSVLAAVQQCQLPSAKPAPSP